MYKTSVTSVNSKVPLHKKVANCSHIALSNGNDKKLRIKSSRSSSRTESGSDTIQKQWYKYVEVMKFIHLSTLDELPT